MTTKSPFAGLPSEADDPGKGSAAITVSDTTGLSAWSRGLYVGVTGDVKLSLVDDPGDHTGVVFQSMPVGLYGLAVRQVYETGTTAAAATALIAVY